MAILSSEEVARYSRHIRLPEVGLAGQEALAQSKVLIIGMGGLGSPVAMYLAGAGIGTIGLADFDKVEGHNLQRQILHATDNVGKFKIDSAKEKLLAFNPHITLREHRSGIRIEDAIELIGEYDLVVDGSDNFPTRYLVNDASFLAERPLVYGSIFQFEGQASVFNSGSDAPCYRCLFPKLPAPGAVPNCEEAGVFGALCGVIGSLQAMEAIKLILGLGESLAGRLLVIDSMDMRFRTLNLKKDPKCPLCGEEPEIRELQAGNYEFSCQVEPSAEEMNTMSECPIEISIEEAKEWLDREEGRPFLLDVREPFELEICKIPGAINIPMRTVAENLEAIPQDKPVLVQCHHGGRSLRVTQLLRSKGFDQATNMAGGIHQWALKFDPDMATY